MRILMIPSGYYPECCGGVEVITQALSEGLVKMGNEVLVLCQSSENKKETINGVVVYKFKPHEFKNPKNSKHIYKINRLLQMYNPFNIRGMRRIIKEINPDIVHMHMTRTLSMSVFKVVEDLKIPIVSTLHEYFSLWNFDPFGKMKDILISKPQWYVELIRKKHRRLTKKVNYITAPLYKTIETYQKEGYYKGVYGEEILNSLPLQDEKERLTILNNKLSRIGEDSKVAFLIISRLMPFKGIEMALEAFMNTPNKNFELNVVGDGELANYVIECSKKDKRIKYRGYLIGKEKDQIFKSSDVLLFPTTELETFGLVVLEAYSYSMPVIASDVAATRRIIDDEETGKIIKEIDAKKLEEQLIKYNDKEYLKNQVSNSYKKAAEFDYTKFINEYYEVYCKVLKEVKNEG